MASASESISQGVSASKRQQIERWNWGDPVDEVRRVLLAGGVVVMPSESSYGLAVDPRNAAAVDAIFALKGREAFSPLPVVIADIEQLATLGIDPDWPPLTSLAPLWPAPLSVLVPLGSQDVPAAAGGATLAIRIPAHSQLCDLLGSVGLPWTATSANRSGEPPCLAPDDVIELLTERLPPTVEALVIDDGILPGGPPSTLVAWAGDRTSEDSQQVGPWRILRAGRYPATDLPHSRLYEVTIST